jgi:hypothetical protein
MSVMCVEKHKARSGMSGAGRVRPSTQEQEIRIDKVLDVKRQLAEGRYDVADKLDVAVDRLLEDLLGQGRKSHTAQ